MLRSKSFFCAQFVRRWLKGLCRDRDEGPVGARRQPEAGSFNNSSI
jgi:hypothetical protein